MKDYMYTILKEFLPIEKIGIWETIAKPFNEVAGFSAFGDIFVRNKSSGQFGLIFTTDPELVPLDLYTQKDFIEQFLKLPRVEEEILQAQKFEAIRQRLGLPGKEEIYIAEPYIFLGGDGLASSYNTGKIWTYLDLVGYAQGLV